MINSLTIKNYALIEDIRVEIFQGLTIITGETGAGKSILLGALGLLLGKRADLGSVKDSSKKCVVEGQFLIEKYGLEPIFEENDLDYEPQTIIRREILPGGKSRAFVNDTPVTLSQLQALSPHLVDVHSQNETLELASENFQLEVLDALAQNSKSLISYRKSLSEYTIVSKNLSELKSKKESSEKELEYNSFLYNELKQAGLKGMNQEDLESTFETLNNSEVIQDSFLQINKLLNEEQTGSLELAKEARVTLGKIKGFSSTFENFWERLNAVVIELEDLSEEINNTSENIEADPEQLYQINEKLQTLYKLQQKHAVSTVSELSEIEQDLEVKVNFTLGLEDEIKSLEDKQQKIKKETLLVAAEIHKNRSAAIPNLKSQLEEIVALLGLPNAKFQFELTDSQKFSSNGTDTLDLLFTANKGLAFGNLKKVASGGEMSRIMLAVKAVLSRYKKLPTIVFDEIDTGVSGEIATKMADIMFKMSKEMQVLSITHLPQIAAKGEQHIKVYKEDVDEVTRTHLKTLSDEERIVEIAQMLGGNKMSEAAIANAKELLN